MRLGNFAVWVWLALGIAYFAFFFWYTSFAGPLTPEEITRYSAVVEDLTEGDPERIAAWQHFMETDTGDDWAMISVVDLRETPTPAPGVEPGQSSEEVLERYTEPFFSQVIPTGAHPVAAGSAAAPAIDIWGVENATDWSEGVLVRWRSRRDIMQFMEDLQAESRDGNIHDFKIAAIEKTIAYPLDPWFQVGAPRLILALAFLVIGLSVELLSRRESTNSSAPQSG